MHAKDGRYKSDYSQLAKRPYKLVMQYMEHSLQCHFFEFKEKILKNLKNNSLLQINKLALYIKRCSGGSR